MSLGCFRIDITKQQKYAFISSVLFGLITHGTMLFNKLSNRDDIRYMFSGGVTFSLGRWMLYIVEKLKNILFQDSVYNIPIVNGIFLLCCIGVSLCLLIDLFEIQSVFMCVLLSCVMTAFPTVTAILGYMFIAQFFGLALLLSVLGPYIILRSNKWFGMIIGIMLMTFSVGIYQAYIPIMICIFLFWLIQQFSLTCSREERFKIYKKIPVIIVSLVGFLALYYAATIFFVRVSGEKLSGYKGIGTVTKVPFSEYLQRVLFAYKEFFMQRKGSFYDVFIGNGRTLFLISIVISVIFLIIYCWSIRKQHISLIYTIILASLVPLSVNFIFVMVDETYCNALMVYGYVMFFIFFVWIYEKILPIINSFITRLAKICTNATFLLLVIIFFRFDNLCYMRLNIVQSQTTRYYSTLITRIQSTAGYDASMKVVYIGKPQINNWDTTIPEIAELNYITVHPYFGFRQLMEIEPWRSFMEIWLNFKAWEADPKDFVDLPEVRKMACYPNDGSIRIINHAIVVKFAEVGNSSHNVK